MMNEQKTVEKSTFLTYIKEKLRYFHAEFIKFPAYIITHPLKGYDEFKREKRAKVSVALTFIVLIILLNILSFQYSGFEVNFNELSQLNTFAEILYIVAPIILFTVANWSVTTLVDGKGTMKEIFLMISYSLYPLIWATGIGIILSNVLTGEEMALYYLVIGLGGFIMGYMVFIGMISIHEFGLFKCILTVIFTMIALAIILFVFLLMFGLFQQMYGFLYTIYREITLRDLIQWG